MRRGDIITVAISGDYGEQRPALVIKSDFLPETDSVLVCLLTSTIRDAPLYRLAIAADASTGLRKDSQVMIDKIFAVRRDRCGAVIGGIGDSARLALGRLLAFAVGIAD